MFYPLACLLYMQYDNNMHTLLIRKHFVVGIFILLFIYVFVSTVTSDKNSAEATTPPSPPEESRPSVDMGPGICNPNWSHSYKVPWEKMPSLLMRSLRKEERSMPSLRREMIRILISDIRNVCDRPLKKQLCDVARQIVDDYPKSFRDELDGNIVGSGYDSVLKQMVLRVENEQRKSTEMKPKIKPSAQTNTASEQESAKQRKMDCYGCVNFNPSELPEGESEETLLIKVNELKSAFQTGKNSDVEEENMQLTYSLQRKDILSENYTVLELKDRWPYLFEEKFMIIHFDKLIGKDSKLALESSLCTKGRRILAYMKNTVDEDRLKIIVAIENAKDEMNNESPEIPGILLLVMNYFKENSNSLFVCSEVRRSNVHAVGLFIAKESGVL